MTSIPTFIINMPERKDRRANMVALMQRIGIRNYEFVEPIPKNALPPGFESLPPGYASLNATVIHKIFSRVPSGPFLVFEDDAIERVDHILDSIHKIIDRLRYQAWDMVYLEYCMETCQNTGNDVISRANQPYCTAAMLYNGDSVDKITHCLAKEGRLIDFSYAQCIRDARIDAFIADPVLFAQDASYGAGDLSHLKPGNVQWFLDFIIRMYPDLPEPFPP